MKTHAPQTGPIPGRSSLELLDRFRAIRACTMSLAAPLSPEDMMVQSCPEASPVKWHLAHTTWFFETFVLSEFLPGYESFNPDFHWLFNSYYNSLGEMPEKKLRASFSRPPLLDILAYRAHVDGAVQRLLETPSEFETNDASLTRIALGLEHEQQHQELSITDIKHALFTNPLHPAYKAEARFRGRDQHRSAGGMGSVLWRSDSDRVHSAQRRGQLVSGLLFRQRNSAPHRLSSTFRIGDSRGDLRGVPGVYGGRRLYQARAVALRRLGNHSRTGLAASAVLAARPKDRIRVEDLHSARLAGVGNTFGDASLPRQLL